MTQSIARWQAKQLAAPADQPAFLSDPSFRLDDAADLIMPQDTVQFINAQFVNSSSNGYGNVQVTVTDVPLGVTVTPNPEVLGTIGAANAGFTNLQVQVPFGVPTGTFTMTMTMTGELGGDVYGDTATVNLTIL